MTTRPRTPCILIKRTQTFDGFGRPIFSDRRIRTKCDVVELSEGQDQTSLRLDTSGSHGRIEEYFSDAKLIFKPSESISTSDVIRVPDFGDSGTLHLRVNRIQRRTDVAGRVHHIEVGANRFDPAEEAV